MSPFPLRLNAVEQYMLADDSADYPRCFSIVAQLQITLDETRLREAILFATHRHPLLRALIEYHGDRPTHWIECTDPDYELQWADDPADSLEVRQEVPRPLDLRREPGVRFRVRRDAAGDSLEVEFHHACTDGIGAIQFIGDLLTAYELGMARAKADLPSLDARRLISRDDFGLTGWRRPLRWLYGTFGWLGAIEFLAHRPIPLGNMPSLHAETSGRPNGYCSFTLSQEQTSALVYAAKSAGVTVNDLMIRSLFLAQQELIEGNWPERAKSHQRIMVPINLRSAGDELLPAANVVAMVNIDRRPHRWRDRGRMLRALHWELATVKRLRLGIVFVLILATLHRLFGSLKRFLPRDKCQATSVASNLGQILPHIDSSLLRAVEFYPPIRPLTAAALGIATHGGKLTISLQFDAAAMSVEQGVELFERFVGQLQEGCGADKCAASGRWYSSGKVCRSADS